MKKFINQQFIAALDNTFEEVTGDYLFDLPVYDDLTDWEFDQYSTEARRHAYRNRLLVLQRQHGVPGEHDFQLGYCHNMTR